MSTCLLVNPATRDGRERANKRLGLTFGDETTSHRSIRLEPERFAAYVLYRHAKGWRAKTIAEHLHANRAEVHAVLHEHGHAKNACDCHPCPKRAEILQRGRAWKR